MNQDWKYEFKDKMSGYGESAPEGLWERIDAGVAASGRKRRAVLRGLVSLGAAAAFAGILVLFSPGTDTDGVATAISPEESAAGGAPASAADPRIAVANPVQDESVASDNLSGGSAEGSSASLSAAVAGADEGAEDSTGLDDNSREINIIHPESRDWQEILLADSEIAKSKSRKSRGISLNVSGSGFFSGAETTSGYSSIIAAHAAAAPMLYTSSPLADIMMFNRSKNVNTRTRHYLPVTAAVTVAWQFAPRWSLETGIMYSWLLSTSRTGSDSYYVDTRQNVHYLGIPLNLGFDFFNNGKLRIYASAGGMVEKSVGGSIGTDYIYGNDSRTHESERLNIKPLQWSASLRAGVQYNFTDFLGLYLEPGAVYHFPTGSDIATSYTEHPLNFHLALGLRFSFR